MKKALSILFCLSAIGPATALASDAASMPIRRIQVELPKYFYPTALGECVAKENGLHFVNIQLPVKGCQKLKTLNVRVVRIHFLGMKTPFARQVEDAQNADVVFSYKTTERNLSFLAGMSPSARDEQIKGLTLIRDQAKHAYEMDVANYHSYDALAANYLYYGLARANVGSQMDSSLVSYSAADSNLAEIRADQLRLTNALKESVSRAMELCQAARDNLIQSRDLKKDDDRCDDSNH